MFQRFHRVDNRDTREIGGTGIGLFLVKNLVEIHHGKIWIESEVAKARPFSSRCRPAAGGGGRRVRWAEPRRPRRRVGLADSRRSSGARGNVRPRFVRERL
jgi:signal transduction histidine kinase